MTDQGAGWYERKEPDCVRLDRNYAELLQELRLVQTGVQILFAFLLALAFQQRFASVNLLEQILYIVALFSAACASILLTAPAAVHRVLFRRNIKDEIVDMTASMVKAGMVCLAIAMLTGVSFVVTFVIGVHFAVALCGLLAALVITTWLVLPWRKSRSRPARPLPKSTAGSGARAIQPAKADRQLKSVRRMPSPE
jgi:Family of unknown function (DUF6328)